MGGRDDVEASSSAEDGVGGGEEGEDGGEGAEEEGRGGLTGRVLGLEGYAGAGGLFRQGGRFAGSLGRGCNYVQLQSVSLKVPDSLNPKVGL